MTVEGITETKLRSKDYLLVTRRTATGIETPANYIEETVSHISAIVPYISAAISDIEGVVL